MKTADLLDAHPDSSVCEPIFRSYGGNPVFGGPIRTVKAFEDNSAIKQTLSEPGNGCVLVVDAGGSRRCAMLGDLMAQLAIDNGWVGAIFNGMIRDSDDINRMPIGVKSLGTMPLRSVKEGIGKVDVPVHFAGVTFRPGQYVYADHDGVIVSDSALSLPG